MPIVRALIPTDFKPIDEVAYLPGSPTSAWLGQRLAANTRYLDANIRRSWGESFVQNSPTIDMPVILNPKGELVGPYTHWGTRKVTQGEFYLRMAVPAGTSCTVIPFVSTPELLLPHPPRNDGSLGETVVTDLAAGALYNYGPFPCPLVPGYCRIGLLVVPPDPDSVVDLLDEGEVYWANMFQCVGLALDSGSGAFHGLTRPYPVIQLFDGANPICQPTQITGIGQTFVEDDTVTTDKTLTHSLVVYDQSLKPAITWKTMSNPAVTIGAVYFRELFA